MQFLKRDIATIALTTTMYVKTLILIHFEASDHYRYLLLTLRQR